MRGKVCTTPPKSFVYRITPAYAGKSSVYLPCSRGCTDHPRLCGEKYVDERSSRTDTGITPAYAGKSSIVKLVVKIAQDHPRLCGEKAWNWTFTRVATGSPPPMRGKVQYTPNQNICQGITPAYAGKSKSGEMLVSHSGDHPRLCGEKFLRNIPCTFCTGSPPPMRGKVCRKTERRKKQRITPAYAGKRLLMSNAPFLSRDHPRLCGEKLSSRNFERLFIGSPPPMRGKVRAPLLDSPSSRITPAYAGKRVMDFL